VFTRSVVLTFVVLLAAAVASPASAKDARENGFTGKWALDKNKTKAPASLQDLEQRIKDRGGVLSIESKFPEPTNGIVPLVYLGIMTTMIELKTDGSEAQNQIGPFQQASKTTINGNTMETDWMAEVKGDKVNGHWTRTLSDDGKSMTLQIKEESTQGQHSGATLYFKRK
jgi:hypothetical protein